MAIDHTRNCLTQAISAAEQINIVMARIGDDHGLQPHLIDALHSILIVAEECRQELKERPDRKAAAAAARAKVMGES